MSRDSRISHSKQRKPGKYEQRAAEQFAGGDLARAAKHCRRALQDHPDRADLWHLLASIKMAQGEFTAAYAAITHARRFAPDNVDYANMQALIRQRRGDHGTAESA